MDVDIPLAVVIRLSVFLISLVLIGFFSGSETAFIGMDMWAITGLASSGNTRAQTLKSLSESKELTISTILVGTNVFTVLASVMGLSLTRVLGLSNPLVLGLVPLFITFLVFLFSELVPKIYAASKPTETALACAEPLQWVLGRLKPLAWLFLTLPASIVKIVPKVSGRSIVSDEVVRAAADLAGDSSDVSKEDTDVIYGVLDSSDTRLGEIMVPLDSVISVTPDAAAEEVLAIFKERRLSRIPVLDDKTQTIIGIIYMKDVLRCVLGEPGPRTPVFHTARHLLRNAFTADIGQNVLDLLAKMRKGKVHMAAVAQKGRHVGIITIEDLIEEILGDIPEDSEAPEQSHVQGGHDFVLGSGVIEK